MRMPVEQLATTALSITPRRSPFRLLRRTPRYLLGALVFSTPMAISRTAAAQEITTSFFGSLLSGSTDTLGLFGPVGGDLSNMLFTINYAYLPGDFLTSTGQGCEYYSTVAGALTGSVTINNHTVTFPGNVAEGFCSGVSYTAALNFGGEGSLFATAFGGFIPSGGASYDSYSISYITSQLGTLYAPGLPATGGSVSIAVFSTKTTNNESLSGFIGPQILLYDYTAQKYTPLSPVEPVYVVVGQPINLMANPAPSQGETQPWKIEGKPIGGYQVDANCMTGENPCTASLPHLDLRQATANFYWTVPGIYTVTYKTDENSGDATTVTFNVAGPNNPTVTVDAGLTAPPTVKIVKDDKDRVNLGCHDTCITFTPPIDTSGLGSFFWAQKILTDQVTYTDMSGTVTQCATKNALDTMLPYPSLPTGGTQDNPSSRLYALVDDMKLERYFSARMYLFWKANQSSTVTNPIFVSFGYVQWGYDATATQKSGVWSATPVPVLFNPFFSYSVNPTWGHVSHGSCK